MCIGNTQPILNELNAVKKVLISFYLALPIGSMLMGGLDEDTWVNVTGIYVYIYIHIHIYIYICGY
jgi:hypothetical protein